MSSQTIYTATGSTDEFDLTFTYGDASELNATVNGAAVTFTLISPTRVKLTAVPTPESEVRLFRITDVGEPVVDYEDGATLLAAQLDASQSQVLKRLQEVGDLVSSLDGRSIRGRAGESLPPLPLAADRANKVLVFDATGKPTVGESLDDLVEQAEAAADSAEAAAASAYNAPNTAGTSTTSLTISSGSKSLTTQPGKNFFPGQPVRIAATLGPDANYMDGIITAYDNATGAMTAIIAVGGTAGSGTLSSWRVFLTGPRGANGVIPGDVLTMGKATGRTGGGGRIIMISDDGYQSVYANALPILRERGQVMNVAVEIERVGSIYPVGGGLPTITAAQYRELIDSGWQIVNHPNLVTGDSLSTMVQKFRDENRLFQQLLTGAKVATGTTGVFTDGTVTHPQYDTYNLVGAVWRGGVNNATSDMAGSYIYDYGVRDVPAPDADTPYLFTEEGERPMLFSGYIADTSNQKIEDILNLIKGVAATGSTAILYVHHIPVGPKSSNTTTPGLEPPQLTSGDLEEISRLSYELGVSWVRWSDGMRGNLVRDARHDHASATFSAAAGDTADYVTTPQYLGAARHIRLNATAYRTSAAQTSAVVRIGVRPFHRYRLTYYYVIGTDLTLQGGPANRNHGITATMSTIQAAGAASSGGTSEDWTLNGANDATGTYRRPYQANGGGIQRHQCLLTSGNGWQADLRLSLVQAIGEARILFWAIEDLGEYHTTGLTFSHTFNGTAPRIISLPAPPAAGARQWKWELSVTVASGFRNYTTVTFAETSDANLPATPATGDTCYVLGAGAGAFAGQGGTIATRTAGGAWTFAVPASNSFIRVNGLSEGIGGGRRWFHASRSVARGALNEEIWTDDGRPDFWATGDATGSLALVSSIYRRLDTFWLTARPVPVTPTAI